MASVCSDQIIHQMGVMSGTLKAQGQQLADITDEFKVMNKTLAVQAEQLAYHIRRTEQNEEALALHREELTLHRKAVEERILPLEHLFIAVQAYIKLFLFFLGVPACLYYMIRIWKEMH